MRFVGPCKSVQDYRQCLFPFRVAALTRLKRKRCLILQSNVNGMEDFERERGATTKSGICLGGPSGVQVSRNPLSKNWFEVHF